MAGRKEFELLFKLKATLGGNFNSSFTNAMNTTQQLQNTLSKINATQVKIDGYKKQAQAITNNRTKLAELTEEHNRLQQEMNQTGQPSEDLRKKFERNARQIDQTTARIEEQEARLNTLGGQLRDVGVNTDHLSQENDRLSQSYDKVRKSQEHLARIADAQKKNDEAIAKTKSQLGGTIGVIAGVGAAIYAGPVKKSIEFQTAMAKVGTIADESAVPLSTMQKDILKLSSTVGVSASLISDDVYNAISAGQSTENAVAFTEKAVKLAKGGFAETGQALDVLTTIINAYGLESEDAGKISDMLIQTQNKGKVTVAELSSVMGKIIPTAKSNNVALEQVCAGYAIMTSKGIAAAETTTYMNSMLNELGKSGTKADKALKKTAGAGFKELMAQGKSIAEVLDILDKAAQESGLSLSDMFGSAEAGKAALTLMADGVDGFNESVDGMLNSTGAADAAFEKMANTAQDKIDKAKVAFENLSIIIGNTFLPYVTAGAEKLAVLITKLSDWAMENPELVKTIIKITGGLAAFRVGTLGAKLGFLELKGGVLEVQKIFEIFKGKLASSAVETATNTSKLTSLGKGILNYFGGIKSALGGVGNSISKFNFVQMLMQKFNTGGLGQNIINGILSPFKAISGKIGSFLSPIGNKVLGFFGGIGNAIVNGPLGKIGGVFKSLGGVASSVLGPLTNSLGGMFGGLFGKIMPVIMIISLLSALFLKLSGQDMSGFIEPLKQAFEQTKPVIESVIKQFKEMAVNLMPLLINAANKLAPLFGQIVVEILPILLSLIQSIVPIIIQIVQDILPAVINIITQLAPLFTDVITTILPIIVQLLETLLPIISELVTAVLPIIVDILNQILPIIMQLIQEMLPVLMQLLQVLMPVVQFVAELFGNVLGSALQSISKIVGNVMQVFQGLIDFITGVFTGNWSKAWEGVKSIFSGVFNGLKNILKGAINFIITGINTFLGGLNKLKLPDWVPGIGGKGINIPLIPMLAKGSNNTPDTFIAGEAGAELVTNAKGRKVFTAAQTDEIFKNLEMAKNVQMQQMPSMFTPQVQSIDNTQYAQHVQQTHNVSTISGVSAPTVTAGAAAQSINFTLQSNPVFHVNGGNLEELQTMFEQYQQDILNKVNEMLRKKEDDERRGCYD